LTRKTLLVLPASVDDVDKADVVAIALRMTKDKVEQMIESGEFDEKAGKELLQQFEEGESTQQSSNTDKKNLNAAGVRADSKGAKTALVYVIFAKLKLKGKRRRCVIYMAGENNILSCRRNPYWNDRVPVLSEAALKVNGSFWGKSRVEAVEKLQYAANDAFNMGQDNIKYSLMPVTIVDPEKFQKTGSIVLTQGAIWLGDPNAIKIVEFPSQQDKTERIIGYCSGQIMQSLSVNPAMMPGASSGKKPTQAQIMQDQQTALASTTDAVTIIETAILNKLIRWFYELDYQFRDKKIMVRKFGTVGIQAEMQEIEPFSVDAHYSFKWYGTEGNKTAQQVQQMISLINVMKEIPPEQLGGRKLDLGPALEHICNSTFGPRIAPKVLIDQSHMLSLDPIEENSMMSNGFIVSVQPMDNDAEHLRIHMAAADETGDPTGNIRVHIMEHEEQMKAKQPQIQQIQGPNGAGGPRPGAQAQMPTGPQQPPGAVHPDQMEGPTMPRERNPQ
jgi:hypothetical protein